MPKLYSDPAIETAGELHDPKKFVDLLKRHSIEINSIITDVERRNDPNLVRKYFNLFASMFSGGYTSLSDRALSTFDERDGPGSIRKKLEDWHNLTNKNDDTHKAKTDYFNQQEPGQRQVKREYDDDDDDPFDDFLLGDEELTLTAVSSSANKDEGDAVPTAPVFTGDGAPPPPPPPPPGEMAKKKPSILPVNFDEILAKDIKGTIWGTIDGLGLPESTLSKLENDLKIIFGKDARNSGLDTKEEKSITLLESGRLRNIEILLRMDELKGLSFEDIIDGFLTLDPRVFQVNVLERLVRKVGASDNKVHAFLPTDKEIELLKEYQGGNSKHKEPLTNGEHFFLSLATKIPDRVERLEFSFFIHKIEEEYGDIEFQLEQINTAIDAVRNSDRFKKVLRVILEIINVLNPKYGNTRGFKLSTFVPKVERAHGAVANPLPKKKKEEKVEELVDDKPKTKEELKQERINKLRRKNKDEEDEEGWKVLLLEYLTVYTAKYKECQCFWKDFKAECLEASCIDILSLDSQSLSWMSRTSEMAEFVENSTLPDSDPFISKLKTFLNNREKIKDLRDRVEKTRVGTEQLWEFFGEKVDSEPQMIFKYIHDFGAVFEKHYKSIKSSKETKVMILKGKLPLIQHKVREKKKEKKKPQTSSSSKPKGNSKLDDIRRRLETREDAEDDVGEVVEEDNSAPVEEGEQFEEAEVNEEE